MILGVTGDEKCRFSVAIDSVSLVYKLLSNLFSLNVDDNVDYCKCMSKTNNAYLRSFTKLAILLATK